MRTRVISSFGVVAVGVVSSVLGGAIFAAAMAALAIGAYFEIARMTPLIGIGVQLRYSGYAVIVLAASIALLTREPWALPLAVAIGILLPGTLLFRAPPSADTFLSMIATMAVALYLGISTFGAISMREMQGGLDINWANDLGELVTVSGDSTAMGMAWTMLAIGATWLSDTFALLVGRSIGRTPLVPHVSPKKTLEGAAGSVLGAVIATVALVALLGIPDVSIPLAIAIGVVFAVVGMYGDLLESFVKRSAGVKDSGTIIPGHGGIFDRIDALLPTLVVAWIIATAITTQA